MIDHLHNAKLNAAMIDTKTQLSIILQSLPSKFQQFKNNYVMNKVSYNLTQLLNELQAFESVNDRKGSEANVAKAFSIKNKKNKRKLAVKNKGKFKKKGKPNQKGNSKRTGNKDKGNCFHCKKLEHWKRSYKQYLDELKTKKKEKGKCDLLVLETCLVESDIST